MKRERGVTYIATISGGKDSVTMCDLLLKNGYPVDYIVFNDTLDEFQEMYLYIDKVNNYFKERYKKEITILKPKKSYDDYIFGVRGERASCENRGRIGGLPSSTSGFCEWRRDSKIVPLDKFAKQFKKYKVYIGITTDEVNRANREDCKLIYPLIDIFKMSELMCKQYLINQDMENPLYRHFNRTGCAKCQYQSDKDWYTIYKHYPAKWEEMKYYENKVNEIKNPINKHWFSNYRTCEDMEKIFKEKDKQGSLFDFSDEPLKDCFCKI